MKKQNTSKHSFSAVLSVLIAVLMLCAIAVPVSAADASSDNSDFDTAFAEAVSEWKASSVSYSEPSDNNGSSRTQEEIQEELRQESEEAARRVEQEKVEREASVEAQRAEAQASFDAIAAENEANTADMQNRVGEMINSLIVPQVEESNKMLTNPIISIFRSMLTSPWGIVLLVLLVIAFGLLGSFIRCRFFRKAVDKKKEQDDGQTREDSAKKPSQKTAANSKPSPKKDGSSSDNTDTVVTGKTDDAPFKGDSGELDCTI